jgi:hypothetical protein
MLQHYTRMCVVAKTLWYRAVLSLMFLPCSQCSAQSAVLRVQCSECSAVGWCPALGLGGGYSGEEQSEEEIGDVA